MDPKHEAQPSTVAPTPLLGGNGQVFVYLRTLAGDGFHIWGGEIDLLVILVGRSNLERASNPGTFGAKERPGTNVFATRNEEEKIRSGV